MFFAQLRGGTHVVLPGGAHQRGVAFAAGGVLGTAVEL